MKMFVTKDFARVIFITALVYLSYDNNVTIIKSSFTLPTLFLGFFSISNHGLLIIGFMGYSIIPYIYNELNIYYFYDHGLLSEPNYDLTNSTQQNTFTDWTKLEPAVGDMIEFRRTIFYFFDFIHWGIYDGDRGIIDYVVDRNGVGHVRLETLENVAHQELSSFSQSHDYLLDFLTLFSDGDVSLVRVNNMEKIANLLNLKRHKPKDIYQSAVSALLSHHKNIENRLDVDLVHYDKLKRNCEHFVTECSFGVPFSFQTDKMYTYWTKEAVKDFKTVFLFYQLFAISTIRTIVKKTLNKIFTDSQLVKILDFISTTLTMFDDAVNDTVPNILMERIWVYVPLFILVRTKRFLIQKLNEMKVIHRRRQRENAVTKGLKHDS